LLKGDIAPMTVTVANLKTPRVNPDWATLPLFDRTGWTKVRFGEVVENLNETVREPGEARIERFIGLEHLEPGSLHVRQWGNVADGTTFTRRCRPGQVLFGKRRAYQRKVAVAEFDAVVSGDTYVLVPADSRLLPELLPFLCLSERFFQHAVGTSAGSLSPRTNWGSLASFEFDLPPLEQQRRIAEILSSMNQVQVSWEAARDSLVSGKRTMLEEFLGRGLGGNSSQSTDVGRIPDHWQLVPLQHCAKRVCVGLAMSVTKYYRSPGSI